jgi:hypothetical protein
MRSPRVFLSIVSACKSKIHAIGCHLIFPPTPCRDIGRWIMDPEQSVGEMEKKLLHNLILLGRRMRIACKRQER